MSVSLFGVARRVIPATILAGAIAFGGLAAGIGAHTASAASAPSVTVGSAWAGLGGSVAVTGSGFAPNEVVSVMLVGQTTGVTDPATGYFTEFDDPYSGSAVVVPVSGVIATIQADASGNLPATWVTIPGTVLPDFYALTAIGTTGDSANAALIVQ